MDRPTIAVIKLALEYYFGKIVIPDDKLRFTANFNHRAVSGSEQLISASIRTPSFNLESGDRIDTSTVVVVPEVSEQTSYLTQWLRLGRKKYLTFFDRGANVLLVQRRMAVASRLELVTLGSTVLTGVGGVKLETDYAGNYRFNLGPGPGGEYHELYCLGMESVTAKFNKSNLKFARNFYYH